MNSSLIFLSGIASGIIIGLLLRRNEGIKESLILIINKLNKMAANDEKALQELEAIKTNLQKVGNESAATLALVKQLQDTAGNNPGTPQVVLDKIAEVAAQVKVVDDLTPDAEPPV